MMEQVIIISLLATVLLTFGVLLGVVKDELCDSTNDYKHLRLIEYGLCVGGLLCGLWLICLPFWK